MDRSDCRDDRHEERCRGKGYLGFTMPSPWVERFAPLVRSGGIVMDLACGNGRNGRLFLRRGHSVIFVDRDVRAVADLASHPQVQVLEADLEANPATNPPAAKSGLASWPLYGQRVAAIVCVNYLHRPLFPSMIDSLAPDGVLLYDTFARGNEICGRPRNPDHLLKAGELLGIVSGDLNVVAYEQGLVDDPACPGVKQRICAVRATIGADGEPVPWPVPGSGMAAAD